MNSDQRKETLSPNVADTEDRELLNRAQAILELFQDAYKLGWSLTLSPEQLKIVIEILECGNLEKRR